VDTLIAWAAGAGGLLVFGVAWFFHGKLKLTRAACILAAIGGFMTYGAGVGSWVDEIAAKVAIVAFILTLGGIGVIIADIKGKKKGADKPALVAFFLVPVFFVSFLFSLPTVFHQLGDGFGKVGDKVTTKIGEAK